jgi:[acyl-carrier-protein] S-malonyltransferase
MAVIADEFRQAVEAADIQTPQAPVIGNVHARPLQTVMDIRQELLDQLTSSVRWTDSIEYMVEQGVTEFVELGPRDVLTGLVRRINKDVKAVSCGTVEEARVLIAGSRPGD